MESLKREELTHFEKLSNLKSNEERREYADALYKSYFKKNGCVNGNKVRADKNMLECFIEECKSFDNWQCGIERFSLLLQVI